MNLEKLKHAKCKYDGESGKFDADSVKIYLEDMSEGINKIIKNEISNITDDDIQLYLEEAISKNGRAIQMLSFSIYVTIFDIHKVEFIFECLNHTKKFTITDPYELMVGSEPKLSTVIKYIDINRNFISNNNLVQYKVFSNKTVYNLVADILANKLENFGVKIYSIRSIEDKTLSIEIEIPGL